MTTDSLFFEVKQFLEDKEIEGGPLLVGYSGGPDSTALLHLLIQCKKLMNLDLHLLHVDHGWRQESREEALQLKREAELLGLPFHLQTLTKSDFEEGNWEQQAREHRLSFFCQIYEALGAKGLFLGHHADDWAEVVLKRVFEGASLPFLGGLARSTQMRGMQVFRPLLPFPKDLILRWLAKNGLPYFTDPTNQSRQFLRGRMRQDLLPFLNQSFGKEIGANLCHLGEEAQELKAYFSSLNRPLLDRVDGGGCLDLKEFLPLPPVQLRYLLKEWAQKEGVFLSRQMVRGAVEALLKLKMAHFDSSGGRVEVNNGRVSLIKNAFVEKNL